MDIATFNELLVRCLELYNQYSRRHTGSSIEGGVKVFLVKIWVDTSCEIHLHVGTALGQPGRREIAYVHYQLERTLHVCTIMYMYLPAQRALILDI
jgi:hypothetical protein